MQALCQLNFVCSEAADVCVWSVVNKQAEWLSDNYSFFSHVKFCQWKVRDFLLPLVQGLPDPIPQSFIKALSRCAGCRVLKVEGPPGKKAFKVQSELFKHAPRRFKQNHLNMQYVLNTRYSVCTLSARERNWVLLVIHAAINKFILLS
jgi:hypothetical protein